MGRRSGFNKRQKDGGGGLAGGGSNATRGFSSGESYSGGGGGGSFFSNSVPLAYYNFDEGSGQTINDVSSAGNNLNGTKSSNSNPSGDQPAWDTTNKVRGNSSLLFDHDDDDAVIVPDNNLLDFNTDDTFSISCWLKRSGATPSQEGGFVTKMANQAGSNDSAFQGYALYTFDTLQKRPAFLLLHDLGANDFLRVIATDANTLNDTNFHNLIVTYNGNSDLSGVKMYLDGSSIGLTQNTDNLEVGESILTNTALAIGGFVNNPAATSQGNQVLNFSGNMDEVAIWTKVLSAAEVTAIYNGGSGVDVRNGIPDD